jgi:serine/threonine protein kinase
MFGLYISRYDVIIKGHQENWYQSVLGAGAFHLDVQFKPAQKADALSIDSFELLKVIGKGSFGKVMQVRKKDTQRVYALKTIRKANIAARPGEITHILAERIVLSVVNSPFIVPLKFSFQTPDKLYLGMSFGTVFTSSTSQVLADLGCSERWRAVPPSATGRTVRRESKSVLRCRAALGT